jgi:hypothetical protein
MRTKIVDPLPQPQPWNQEKWLGSEDAMCFAGEWQFTHSLFEQSYEDAFFSKFGFGAFRFRGLGGC